MQTRKDLEHDEESCSWIGRGWMSWSLGHDSRYCSILLSWRSLHWSGVQSYSWCSTSCINPSASANECVCAAGQPQSSQVLLQLADWKVHALGSLSRCPSSKRATLYGRPLTESSARWHLRRCHRRCIPHPGSPIGDRKRLLVLCLTSSPIANRTRLPNKCLARSNKSCTRCKATKRS